MKKRIAATAILTAAVMALSAGCGQKAAPTEGTGENAGSAKEKVEIEYWALPYGPSDTYDPTLQRIVDRPLLQPVHHRMLPQLPTMAL